MAVGVERIALCEWEDLAAIVLRPEGLESLNTEFCPLPRRLAVDSTLRDNGSVLLVGFPVDQTFEVSESRQPGHVTKLMACPSDMFWGEIVSRTDRPLSSRYDAERHLLIRFESSTRGSRPFGYRGAAVWCDPARRGLIWTANPLFLGIETDSYESLNLVLAVRASVVRQFLEESL